MGDKQKEHEIKKSLRRETRRQWIKDKKCRGCGDGNTIKGDFCLQCYLINVSAKRLGTGRYWKDLMNLMKKQNFTCALTGDKLKWGGDIELDHIIPKSRGGKDELSNVRWVSKIANRVKQSLIDSELFEICQKMLTFSKSYNSLKA